MLLPEDIALYYIHVQVYRYIAISVDDDMTHLILIDQPLT